MRITIDICCRHLIKDQQSTGTLHPEKMEDPSDLELEDSPLTPSQTIVRRTKTKTQSKILGNGDLVEQTVVTEVTETVTTSLCRPESCEDCQARCQDFTEVSREEMEEELEEETDSELIEDKEDDESSVPVDRDKEPQDYTAAPTETAYRRLGRKFL